MIFVEVLVNVPIRRTFAREAEPQIVDAEDTDQSAPQVFHYHLPVELVGRVQPGHLVWVPFGRQEIQGIVLALAESAPVPTKPVARLGRPEPVLNQFQLDLAAWIAHTYLAPLTAAVRLFLPPGLLVHREERAVRARRELKVSLLVPPDDARQRLERLAKPSGQAAVLAWLLEHPVDPIPAGALCAACALKSDSTLRTLERQGLLARDGDQVSLAVTPDAARQRLLEITGLARLAPIVEALAVGPLWKSELAARTDADLPLLRDLQGAGIVDLQEEVRFRDPLLGRSYPVTVEPTFTGEQAAVWEIIRTEGFDAPAPLRKPFLLHGVTGSGKTEIYLRSLAATLARGLQAIVLIPEIALTPQTVARFAGRFPGRVTVIHSELNTGERYDVWRKLRAGEFDIVVGPRSALFAPLPRLGLIILDEEHEPTFKQDAEEWGSFQVFYDARTVAQHLAALAGSVLIFGSATPSLERYYAAQQGELRLLALPRRVVGHGDAAATLDDPYADLPPVEVVDMRQELRAGNRGLFSRSLAAELYATLDAGEQALLFLNRRGANTFVMCRDCGHVQACSRCDVPLTFHEHAQELVCHHCNRRYPVPVTCPQCSSKRIKYFGAGTERIAETVSEIAPHARILRWDADTTGKRGSHEELLRRFAAHEADVLIGTQMIAKGLDLPLVTLVGVVAADVGLFLPDFRSGERTFQLLTQVAGRAGRSARGGRVVIQTYRPEHHAIQAAARHDYDAFYRREIAFRQENSYPPVRRLAKLVYWNKRPERAQSESDRLAALIRQRMAALGLAGQAAALFGPTPAFFGRYRGYYRWQILLRAPDPAVILRGVDFPLGWRVDVDPISLL